MTNGDEYINRNYKERNIEMILDKSFLNKQIGDYIITKTYHPTRWHILKNIDINKKTKKECIEIIEKIVEDK